MQPGKDASSTLIFHHLTSVKEQGKKQTKNLPKQLLCTTGDSEDILLSVIQATMQNVQETSSKSFWAEYILSTHSHRKCESKTWPSLEIQPQWDAALALYRKPHSNPTNTSLKIIHFFKSI